MALEKNLSQNHETNEFSAKSKIKIYLGDKLKVSSNDRQDEITRLNELRVLSEAIAEEKERKLLCLNVTIKEINTSKEVFNKKLLHQRDRTNELFVTLKTKNDLGNQLKKFSNVNKNKMTKFNELRAISETTIVNEKNKFICSNKITSCLKEDIKSVTTSKENFEN